MAMGALKDADTQKNGTILICYNVRYSSKNLHLDLALKSSMFAKSIPRRLLGVHFCYDSEIMHPLISMMQSLVGSSARLRFRSHYGTTRRFIR
jgi:hypothetical protein